VMRNKKRDLRQKRDRYKKEIFLKKENDFM